MYLTHGKHREFHLSWNVGTLKFTFPFFGRGCPPEIQSLTCEVFILRGENWFEGGRSYVQLKSDIRNAKTFAPSSLPTHPFTKVLRSIHTKRFTPNNSVTVTVTLAGGTFDLFDGQCDWQNGLHTHFARQHKICDGVASCEWALRLSSRREFLMVKFLSTRCSGIIYLS